jgi:hypothetical protein
MRTENLKGRDRFGALKADGRTMLKSSLMKLDVRLWTGLIMVFNQAKVHYILFA